MSGHSKWHNIQARKGKQDQKKASSFTKVARMITMAARKGGGDANMNFSLRLALEKARAANMPKDNIDRAMKKGTGELADEISLEEILYEGFGPGSIGVLVDIVTDNKNRSASEIKHLFSLHGGAIAGPGSVQWQFAQKGVVRIEKEAEAKMKNADEFELTLIDKGAEDIRKSDFGIEIISPVEKFQTILESVRLLGVEPGESGIEWVAKETIPAEQAVKDQLMALTDALEAHDDVRAMYTNEA